MLIKADTEGDDDVDADADADGNADVNGTIEEEEEEEEDEFPVSGATSGQTMPKPKKNRTWFENHKTFFFSSSMFDCNKLERFFSASLFSM
jgi:hypothetical protein